VDDIEWLNTTQAAERLGLTPGTLYKFINSGSLPGYRFGRVIRIKRSDIDQFIESARIQPGDLGLEY
jgi:excisionase family DNA binding protein